PATVRETLKRVAMAGLAWPLPEDLTNAVLENRLYGNAGTKQGYRRNVEPDWALIHRELKRKHVTLSILWDEYIGQNPDGYRYSRFCELYGGQALGHNAPDPCRRRQTVCRLRRRHRAGDCRPTDRRGAPGADLRRDHGR